MKLWLLVGILVGFLGWGIGPSQGLHLYGEENTEKREHILISTLRAGFESTIQCSRVLNRVTTGI